MKEHRITVEHVLYILAILLGLIFRLLYLGRTGLSDGEAVLALQALSLKSSANAILSPHPAYLLITGTLFSFLGSTPFLARLLPALAGCSLVLAPMMLRKSIGREATVILAFGLALDPGLVSLSRQVGGPMIAAGFGALTAAAWVGKRPSLAGIFGVLAILGGPWIWQGLLGAAIAWFISGSPLRKRQGDAEGDGPANPSSDEPQLPPPPPAMLPRALPFFLGTLMIAGTLFFTEPRGLSLLAGSLAGYFQEWGTSSGITIGYELAALLVYAPLPLFFGIWGAVRTWRQKEPLDRFLVCWLITALVIGLIDPSRQPAGLIWVLLPLWILASRQLAVSLQLDSRVIRPVGLYALVVLGVLLFLWVNFTGLLTTWEIDVTNPTIRILVLAGTLTLLLLTSLLVAWGWSSKIAGAGLLRGFLAALVIYQVGMCSAAGEIRLVPTSEMWDPAAHPAQADLLINTIGLLSDWKTGNAEAVDLVVAGIPSPSLQWELRLMPNVRFVDGLGPADKPSMIITPKEEEPSLAASYRGEAFIWNEKADWPGLSFYQILYWFAFHQAPQKTESILLWARTDLFPGQSQNSTTTNLP